MRILPYKRGIHSHSLSDAKRNARDHLGRAVGALAELLSWLPACPTTCEFPSSLRAARSFLHSYLQTSGSFFPTPPPSILFLLVLSLQFFLVSCQCYCFPLRKVLSSCQALWLC